MDISSIEGPQELVTMKVTGWPEARRRELIQAMEAVRAGTEITTAQADVEVTGWTKELVERAFEHLAGSRATAQIKVIKRAIENGGAITRDEVYAIAGFEPTRSLKGFTRPTNRATNHLRESGGLPDDAEELLSPNYDLTVNSYQRTQGFSIPLEVVKLYSA